MQPCETSKNDTMRYFVFILFLWFVGMHSVNAAIPIKETNFISPVRYKVRLAGSFGELRGRHFHAGLDIKSSQGRSGDSIFQQNQDTFRGLGYNEQVMENPFMSTMPMVIPPSMPTWMATIRNLKNTSIRNR